MKDVVVLVGAGSIGQACARRVGAGKHVVQGFHSFLHRRKRVKAVNYSKRLRRLNRFIFSGLTISFSYLKVYHCAS